jgi:hypothetical protein
MGDTIRKVDYYYVTVPNTAGQGAKILAALAAEGANLLAFTGFPSGRKAQLDFIPEDAAQFQKAARTLKLALSRKKTGFLLQGEDRVGALSGALGKLAEAKISVTAVDAVASGDGKYGALLWVKPENVNKAARLLGAV